jgi:predicted AAA+ superfamily ATPase
MQGDKLVILDEIHRLPGLFEVLRGIIDERRRAGQRAGQFLLLGSASLDLMQQSSETLAGRVAYLEIGPVHALEWSAAELETLWLRGGFPDSLLASSDAVSLRWREDFVRSYLQRDVPMFAPRLPAETVGRLWTMLAHHQGELLDLSKLAAALAISGQTVGRYIDLLCDLMLVRRLPAWHGNVGKRLIRSPKVYVRDSGLVHALLGLSNGDALLGHPVAGSSWEGFVLEQLINAAPQAEASFYRTSNGAEVDLVLTFRNQQTWVIEIKRSSAPTVSRGFYQAATDLGAVRKLLVAPVAQPFPLKDGIEVVDVMTAIRWVTEQEDNHG